MNTHLLSIVCKHCKKAGVLSLEEAKKFIEDAEKHDRGEFSA